MKRWKLALAVTAILAALALLVLAGACGEEEELGEDTPTPQHTQTATGTPSQRLTPASTPTPEPTLTSEPTKRTPTGVTQEPTETTPEASPTPEVTPTPEATATPEETQVPTPESTLPEILRSEIRSIIPPTDLSGLDSFKELSEYVSANFPIITEHYLIQPAGDIAEAPVFPIEVQMKKPGGWREEDKDMYREWQDVTLREIAEVRHLSGDDCRLFLFTAPLSPNDTMTFAGIDRRKPYCPPEVSQ